MPRTGCASARILTARILTACIHVPYCSFTSPLRRVSPGSGAGRCGCESGCAPLPNQDRPVGSGTRIGNATMQQCHNATVEVGADALRFRWRGVRSALLPWTFCGWMFDILRFSPHRAVRPSRLGAKKARTRQRGTGASPLLHCRIAALSHSRFLSPLPCSVSFPVAALDAAAANQAAPRCEPGQAGGLDRVPSPS